MLISPAEIISIAYITNIDEKLLKNEIIEAAVQLYIKPVLSEPLYNDVIVNASLYVDLIEKYIKPCAAFYVKYLIYSQQLYETAEYSNPDPLKSALLLVQVSISSLSFDIQQSIIKDILFIAKQKESSLKDYLYNSHFELYQPSAKKRISGFLLPL